MIKTHSPLVAGGNYAKRHSCESPRLRLRRHQLGEQIELPTLATPEMDDSELTSEEEFPWGRGYIFFLLGWDVWFVDILCWFGLGWVEWSGCFGVYVLFFMGKVMNTNISALITSKNMQHAMVFENSC